MAVGLVSITKTTVSFHPYELCSTLNTYIISVISFPPVIDGQGATFTGQSRITYDLTGRNQYVQTRRDHLKMRFRTSVADGLLFFADGNQGDYVILEMLRGRLFVHYDLG